MKKLCLALTLLVLLGMGLPSALASSAQDDGSYTEYVVVYAKTASLDAARAAIAALGGTIVKENTAVGVATVRSVNAGFLGAVRQQSALFGASRNRVVGQAPQARLNAAQREQMRSEIERENAEREASRGQASINDAQASAGTAEPLASLQWDMKMIGATADKSYARQPGSKKVLVGIIDTGVDGTHPDIAPNFDAALSRNFVTDMPDIDGPCEVPSCVDPANVDENEHGTHVAGTIGAPVNGLGIAGVAPNVTLVNIRAGQDSGYFFLQPSVDALTYAGDVGIDVVNMSYYIDPWLYNCANNPADSPEAQMEQQTIIEGTQRALDYARKHGVTLVAALGNEHTDMGNPTSDTSSPDYPDKAAYSRTIDNSCLDLPAEGKGVIGVSAVGPSGRKSFYSNYGREQTDVAAPGGDSRDFFGTPQYATPGNRILAPYPAALAELNGDLNPDGTPNTPFVIRDCNGDVCGYYQYLQGTSMAAPHAVGVVALIVSEYGKTDKVHGGLTAKPSFVESRLKASAHEVECPRPRALDYPDADLTEEYTATCLGGDSFNGFYGKGVVDAYKAVTYGDD